MKLSGFTFIHNALDSGYPIVEAINAVQPYVDEMVIVDMQSDDGTRDLLEKMQSISQSPQKHQEWYYECPIKILDGYWGNQAGETLRQAHSQYVKCSGDVIIHFEADEVYGDSLIKAVVSNARASKIENCHFSVMRLQLEQNFQRCRWYPEPVHRVFPRLSNVRKEGHTTNRPEGAFLLTERNGYLWDCCNVFRDNWFNRVEKQAELRGEEPNYLMVGHHCTWNVHATKNDANHWLKFGRHWTWINTPFAIPKILKPLVGMTKYEPKL